MQIECNRWGACLVLKNGSIVSLGWNVWGIDRADGTHCIVHIWKPRLFRNAKPWSANHG
jgi:hypothetical protein